MKEFKTIQKEQNKLMTLAKTKKDVKLIQLAVKAIQEITINEMYNNLHKDNNEDYNLEVNRTILKGLRS